MRSRVWLTARRLMLAGVLTLAGCASTPVYVEAECPVFSDLGVVRANPAGVLDRHLFVEASFRVCPPGDGLEEIRRRHIELRFEMLALISAMTLDELTDPLRVEHIQHALRELVNDRVMRTGRVVDVYVTAFELK